MPHKLMGVWLCYMLWVTTENSKEPKFSEKLRKKMIDRIDKENSEEPALIVHVGAGKCGSSALQKYLTEFPEIKRDKGGTIYYSFIREDGDFVFGDKVKKSFFYKQKKGYMYPYIVSPGMRQISNFNNTVYYGIRDEISKFIKNKDLFVLSCEAWSNQSAMFEKNGFFEKINIKNEVVIYIRPQVELINSAWWQWGAWEGLKFEDWLSKALMERGHWKKMYDEFNSLSGVGRVRVRLLPKDIIYDFLKILGAKKDIQNVSLSNRSLPGSVLRVYQRHRNLRPSPHSSSIDFVLEKHLSSLNSPTPWVISNYNMKRIIDNYKEENKLLAEVIEDDQRECFLKNEKWWAPYDPGRPLEIADAIPPDPLELDELSSVALEALFKS